MRIFIQLKRIFNKYKSQLYFHLITNLVVAIFITYASYSHIPLDGFKDHIIYFIHFLLLQFSVFGFLYFLSLNKYIFYIVFPIVFVSLTLLSFFVYTQDIVISKYLIEAIGQTSLLVSIDMISINLLVFILILYFLLRFIFKLYSKITVNQLHSPLLILALLALLIYPVIENIRLNTFKSRMPYIAFYSTYDYFIHKNLKLVEVDENIKSKKKDINFILILGEAVRADHLQLNAYKRKTNPLLSKRKNVISFSNVYTPFTHTVPSVKQMLSNRNIYDGEDYQEVISMFSVLNRAGYDTFWIANSTLVSSYEPIIMSNKHVILIDKFRSIVSFNKALDEKMLKPFDSVLGSTKEQFIGLHMTGSHWWYENRYPEKIRVFSPVIKSKYIPSEKKQNIINSYDNTLVYLDYFINEVITRVEKQHSKAIVLYVADHGELLGEDGKWFHAQNTKYSKNPAMILWFSEAFQQEYPQLVTNLYDNSKKFITTDFLYNSILDILSIENIDYKKTQSIFSNEIFFKKNLE